MHRISESKQFLRLKASSLALGLALGLAACGGSGGGGSGGGTPEPGPAPSPDLSSRNFMPTTVGARWIYQDSDGSALITTRQTGTRAVSGGTGVVQQSSDPDEGETLLLADSSGVRQIPGNNAEALAVAGGPLQILRYPLRLGDSHVVVDKNLGAVLDFDGDGVFDSVAARADTVMLALESIDTPAGRLVDCLHTRTTAVMTVQSSRLKRPIVVTTVSDDWLAPGIGPVRNETTASSEGTSSKSTRMITAYGVGSVRSESVAPTASAAALSSVLPLGAGAALDIAFSETMDSSTLAGALTVLDANGQPVAGTTTVAERSLKFVPKSAWLSGKYTAKLSTAAQDLVGNGLAAAQEWSFVVDTSAPTLLNSTPIAGAVDVPLAAAIILNFSEPVDPASVNAGSISIQAAGISPSLTQFAVSGAQVTLTPDRPLTRGSTVTISIDKVRDLAGNAAAYQSLSFSADPGRFGAPQLLKPAVPDVRLGQYVVTGDFNGDGRVDLASSTNSFISAWSYGVQLFFQQTDGSLAEGVPLSPPSACAVTGLVAGDLNGDGRQDLLVNRASCGLDIYLQSSVGQLQFDRNMASPSSVGAVVRLADMNGDGRLDIVTFGADNAVVQVWRNNAGSWLLNDSVAVSVAIAGGLDLAVGDLNGDGRPDIAVTAQSLSGYAGAALLYQGADGHLGAPVMLMVADQNETANSVAIGDLNGDGRADLVLSYRSNGLALFAQGSGGQLGVMQRLGEGSSPLLLADLNGDGRLDVLMGGVFTSSFVTRLQTSDGNLAAEASYPAKFKGVSAYTGVMALGDVNGDGRPDVIFSDEVFVQRPVPLMSQSLKPGASLAGGWHQRLRAGVGAALAAQVRR
ncbi:FG-GAP-like repeat-containing protein [Roseateles sp. PN1]|uniref:FG-GAP-like repeat-containing protein n=1 Tax=Roseateles sp. PN1 TaxID=3137372 RepID=UPI00313926E4